MTPNFPGQIRRIKIAVKKAKTAARKAARVAVVEEPLRDYELVLIMDPEVSQEKLDSMVENIRRPINKRGGEVADVEHWGKRKLAYPIKKATEGNYIKLRINSRASATREITDNLRISEDVLRYMLISIAADQQEGIKQDKAA